LIFAIALTVRATVEPTGVCRDHHQKA